jgi:N-acetylglucosamine-6-phosphate deacetylase
MAASWPAIFRDDVAVVIEDGRIAAAAGRGPQLAGLPCATWTAAGCCPASSTCRSTAAAARCSTTRRTWRLAHHRAAHRRFGTTGLLPTLISDDVAVMARPWPPRARPSPQGVPGVLGIHLEGPYIAPARKGTHDAHKFRVPDATRSRSIPRSATA